MVLFCVERRKAWRLMQSRVGVINPDYEAQKAVRAVLQEEDADGDRIRFAKERFAKELARPESVAHTSERLSGCVPGGPDASVNSRGLTR